jgi:hypothetical protein
MQVGETEFRVMYGRNSKSVDVLQFIQQVDVTEFRVVWWEP